MGGGVCCSQPMVGFFIVIENDSPGMVSVACSGGAIAHPMQVTEPPCPQPLNNNATKALFCVVVLKSSAASRVKRCNHCATILRLL